MTLCNAFVNTTRCFRQTNALPDTWIHCESCVCMQRLNTACPVPLSLSICQVKKTLNDGMHAKCSSKIPTAVTVLTPLFCMLLCVLLGYVFCKHKSRKNYSNELQTTLNESTSL